MTPKERVIRALKRQGPDKVPRELSFGAFTPQLMEVFKEKTGSDDPAEYFNFEVRSVGFKIPQEREQYIEYHPELPEGGRIDEWGTGKVKGSMYHYEHFLFPMDKFESPAEVEKYPFPDFMNPKYHSHFEREVKAYHDRDLAVMGELTSTLFEVTWSMRGMENLLMDFTLNPDLAEVLLDRVFNLRLQQAKRFAKAGVDIIRFGDDIGQQNGLIMSPETWRKWIKPRFAGLVSGVKEINPDILVFNHCDGDATLLIPEFIEIGVDILNPVQPECMDAVKVKKDFGNRLSFWGTVGTQTTMPFGTPDDVRKVVKERVETVGEGGGLLIAPTHILEPEVPWENVLAFFEAVDEFGYYK
jgi:uroporphyrinogen decarboxylase